MRLGERLYAPHSSDDAAAALDGAAARLAEACVALHELPYIRYDARSFGALKVCARRSLDYY